jgi:hypothetical protein
VGSGDAGYRSFTALLTPSHVAAQYQLPSLIARAAEQLGAHDAVVYMSDLQQSELIPFVDSPGSAVVAAPLPIDSTLAGRAFQFIEVLAQLEPSGGAARVWLPLLDGTERLGVLALRVDAADVERFTDPAGPAASFAALVAQLVMTKSMYGDELVRLRRRTQMGLAAELQWSLLPPLTFVCDEVAIAGALEPAYRVAGDILDYAVDAGVARAAVLDGMGHSLRSSQLAAIAIAGYRNSRRNAATLPDTAKAMDQALLETFDGAAFTTGVMVELDTRTGMLSWINAGHPAPRLLREHRVVKSLTCPPHTPLGLSIGGGAPFTVCHEQLQPGDRVLLFTDGVIEARGLDGEFFGEQRLTDLLIRNLAAGLPSSETIRRVVRALLAHQQGRLSDDASLLLVEWRARVASQTPELLTTPS